ncbi:MAG TPA: hypothetical protein VM238_22910 [Phycisphaerae bacterium]|nr:hypothetical protein [Phycisphaerae bacterium]
MKRIDRPTPGEWFPDVDPADGPPVLSDPGKPSPCRDTFMVFAVYSLAAAAVWLLSEFTGLSFHAAALCWFFAGVGFALGMVWERSR